MDCTITGELKIYADEEVLDKVNEAFAEGECEIETAAGCLTIAFDQSYEIIKNYDYSKSVVDYTKKLAAQLPPVAKMAFAGRYETWSCGSFTNFLCKYDGGLITIYESDNYIEYYIDEALSYDDILDDFGWQSDRVPEECIERSRGKTVFVLEQNVLDGNIDILENALPADHHRKDLDTEVK